LLSTVPRENHFVAVAILSHRIWRALVAAGPDVDPAGLLVGAADLLECHVPEVLLDAATLRIPAHYYRPM